MSNCCLETHCIKCCIQTNMVLSKHDINKIQNTGTTKSFYIQDNGWLRLKNAQGRCVFHDGEKCTMYKNRPEGCTLYPVVYNKDNQQTILDEDCPQKHCFSINKQIATQLTALVATLENEREERQKHRPKEKK